eukprot:scaffold24527_cov83-Cyclotella_meneghiniana.AAC.1
MTEANMVEHGLENVTLNNLYATYVHGVQDEDERLCTSEDEIDELLMSVKMEPNKIITKRARKNPRRDKAVGGSHGRASAPLLSPPPIDPSITTASQPHQQQQQLPQQHDLSRPYVPNVNPNDENDEVDIYIPGIASVRLQDDTTMEQGTTSSSCSNVTMQNQDNYNAQDSNNGSNGREELNKVTAAETKEESAAGSGFEEESYEDLAARFARLQR